MSLDRKSMPIEIREAAQFNVDALSDLAIGCIHDSYREFIPYDFLIRESRERRHRIWNEILNATNSQAYCAVHCGEPVGFVTGGIEKTGSDVKIGQVQSLYVVKSFQGQQLGTALFGIIEEWFVLNSCKSLTVGVLQENAAARRFYEDRGCLLAGHSPYDWHGLELQLCLYQKATT
jgi:GNAT superfamily N-acetyltransferase